MGQKQTCPVCPKAYALKSAAGPYYLDVDSKMQLSVSSAPAYRWLMDLSASQIRFYTLGAVTAATAPMVMYLQVPSSFTNGQVVTFSSGAATAAAWNAQTQTIGAASLTALVSIQDPNLAKAPQLPSVWWWQQAGAAGAGNVNQMWFLIPASSA